MFFPFWSEKSVVVVLKIDAMCFIIIIGPAMPNEPCHGDSSIAYSLVSILNSNVQVRFLDRPALIWAETNRKRKACFPID